LKAPGLSSGKPLARSLQIRAYVPSETAKRLAGSEWSEPQEPQGLTPLWQQAFSRLSSLPAFWQLF
jgi:hypothetical protein